MPAGDSGFNFPYFFSNPVNTPYIFSAASATAISRRARLISCRRGSSFSRPLASSHSFSPLDCSSLSSTAPPACSSTRAFLVWWSAVTLGEGTSTQGLAIAVSSEMVEAPARQNTRSAAAITRGMS